ncbi:MAG: DUF86 domain-containing protein [Armatimonadota bacterium]|nr:DUF86 domain-containing protein [Armatimonadota bacterium]
MGVKERHARAKPLPADLSQRLDALPELLARHPIRAAYLFGSLQDEEATPADVDLAVLPDRGYTYAALYADLSTLLGTDRLDVVDLRVAPPPLQWAAIRGRRIFARSEADAEAFEARVRRVYRDDRLRWHRRVSDLGRSPPMPVRRDLVARLLGELERTAQELEKYRQVDGSHLRADLSLRWTVERGLLAGLTTLFQIAEHILAAHFRRVPETDEGLLVDLRDLGVLPDVLYQELRGAGGFRNVLVHQYVTIDLDEVAGAVRRAPTILRRFAQAISSWLASQPDA